MRPVDIQVIGQELALKWEDGLEQFVALETLRRFCPCAACMGEKDIFGATYRPPERPYGAGAMDLLALHPVGAYAVQPAWRDGHNTGIYSWEWLRRIAAAGVVSTTGCAPGEGEGGHHHGCGGHGGCGGHRHEHDEGCGRP